MKTSTAVKKTNIAPDADNFSAQEKIFNSAEELFIKRGFDGVSINDIAVHANVAKGLIFYYFENKKALFNAVLDQYYTMQAETLMGAVVAKGTVRERVYAGIDAYLDFVEKNPGYPKLIQREICSGSENIEKIMQYMMPMQQWGESVFGDIFPAEGSLSPRHFFISVFGMAINYYTYMPVLEQLWDGDQMSVPALAERREHLHFVLDALMEKFAVS